MKPLFLASKSKHRATLLSQLGLRFQVVSPKIKEIHIPQADDSIIIETVQSNALRKARSLLSSISDGIIISADTVVITNSQEVLGKPQTQTEAIEMLKKLVGKWHRVLSAVALLNISTKQSLVDHDWASVKFRDVSLEGLHNYVATNEPIGKAGGYAIQGRGGFLVEQVQGSYTTVIGLPIELTVSLLSSFNINIWQYWMP
ncbi:MAG: Maf family protein [Candidatus Thorarchaeota archaeon]